MTFEGAKESALFHSMYTHAAAANHKRKTKPAVVAAAPAMLAVVSRPVVPAIPNEDYLEEYDAQIPSDADLLVVRRSMLLLLHLHLHLWIIIHRTHSPMNIVYIIAVC